MSSPSTSILRGGSVKLFAILTLSFTLSACDYVASFTKPKQTPEEAKAEGIALGAGCRQAGQSLEDCYQRNPDKLKAGIFTGWKDMHEYMAAKNIPTVAPPAPEKTEADAAKAGDKDKDAVQDDRAARRERRERERAEREKDSKPKDSDSDRSSRKSRDSGDSSSRRN